jgi:hypothetical protein
MHPSRVRDSISAALSFTYDCPIQLETQSSLSLKFSLCQESGNSSLYWSLEKNRTSCTTAEEQKGEFEWSQESA